MADQFLNRLSDVAELSVVERLVFASAGVTSWEDLDSLLRAFPSLSELGVRTPDLSFAAAREANATYATFADEADERIELAALGALPPENAAIVPGDLAPLDLTLGGSAAPAADGGLDLTAAIPWPVRDQNPRGTCVAFGSAACVEFGVAAGGAPPDLSEQFLYWAIKTQTHDPIPNKDGAWLSQARDALSSHGICDERSWPYLATPVTPRAGATPPQTTIALASRLRMMATTYTKNPSNAAQIILDLLRDNRRPVAISLPVFRDPRMATGVNNWTTRVGWAYGRVLNPPPGSVQDGGHCVCVTGFVPDADEPNGGYFIIRNSWSDQWGALNPSAGNGYGSAAGYGDVSASYVKRYCWELFQL